MYRPSRKYFARFGSSEDPLYIHKFKFLRREFVDYLSKNPTTTVNKGENFWPSKRGAGGGCVIATHFIGVRNATV
jgi:hypothetical protein